MTYAHKIEKAEAAIDWSQPAESIARRIRAFDPFPGAQRARSPARAIKLWAAAGRRRRRGACRPGTVLAAGPQWHRRSRAARAGCALTELQRPGGKRLPAADFLRGFALAARACASGLH